MLEPSVDEIAPRVDHQRHRRQPGCEDTGREADQTLIRLMPSTPGQQTSAVADRVADNPAGCPPVWMSRPALLELDGATSVIGR